MNRMRNDPEDQFFTSADIQLAFDNTAICKSLSNNVETSSKADELGKLGNNTDWYTSR
jgi:hypothetical protein